MQRMMTHRQHLASRISQLSSMGCSFQHGRSLPSLQPRSRALNTRHRCAALPVLALVNIDFNPSLLLGMGLVGGGLTITSLRSVKPVVSRDLDIVIACVAWMSGGILIFQGWRLDPILFFAQTLIVGAAISFSIETYQLRAKVAEMENPDSGWAADKRMRQQPSPEDPRSRRAASTLPPPRQQPWDWLTRAGKSSQAEQSRQTYQYQDDNADNASAASTQDANQVRFPASSPPQQSDDSSWRGSQAGLSSSGRFRDAADQQDASRRGPQRGSLSSWRSRDSLETEQAEADGYFQPQSESSWQQADQAQAPTGSQGRAQENRLANWNAGGFAGAGQQKGQGAVPAYPEDDAPYQPSSRNSNNDLSSDDEWGEQDGYFQPQGDPPQSRNASSSSSTAQRELPQQRQTGWQPSTEDWD